MITYKGDPTGQYERGATMKVHVSGLNETFNRLMKMAERVDVEAGKLVEALVFDGVTIAKEEVPVDTGELRDSIHGEMSNKKLKGAIVAGTDHCIFVEFGTGIRGQATSPIASKEVNYVYDYHNRDWKGNKANPFMHRTAVRLIEDMKTRSREFLDRLVK